MRFGGGVETELPHLNTTDTERYIMSKTPYEIRLELLSMAQSILSEKMYAERMRLENDWQTLREISLENFRQGNPVSHVSPFPIMPTISSDEIIALASKLNEFVSNKE